MTKYQYLASAGLIAIGVQLFYAAPDFKALSWSPTTPNELLTGSGSADYSTTIGRLDKLKDGPGALTPSIRTVRTVKVTVERLDADLNFASRWLAAEQSLLTPPSAKVAPLVLAGRAPTLSEYANRIEALTRERDEARNQSSWNWTLAILISAIGSISIFGNFVVSVLTYRSNRETKKTKVAKE